MRIRVVFSLLFIFILLPIPSIPLNFSVRIYTPPFLLFLFIVFIGISIVAIEITPESDTWIKKIRAVFSPICFYWMLLWIISLLVWFFKYPNHERFYLSSFSDIISFTSTLTKIDPPLLMDTDP
jgi:hypothetical protein